ncbi:MAG: GAF domain-containing protein [Phycisphaerales bacterium]
MTVPPSQSPDEDNRQAALERLNLLDTPIESRFEKLIRRAREEFNVPICAISLIDGSRQWFKSVQGLDTRETSRDVSFCGHTILQPNVLVVEDATTDPTFKTNPLVTGEPGIRFYAGAPIYASDDQPVASFCIIDPSPRTLDADGQRKLQDLARVAGQYFSMAPGSDIEASFIASVGKDRVGSFTDPATNLWNREGITRIANRAITCKELAPSNNMSHGCGVMLIKTASSDDAVMAAAAKRVVHSMCDLDMLGRYEDDTFLAILVGCADQAGTDLVCSKITDRIVEAPGRPLDPAFPTSALPVQTAATFVPFELGACLDEAIVRARRALRTNPQTRAAA